MDSKSFVGGRLGRYEIIEHLGCTDISELVLARVSGPEGFGRPVAIKCLRREHAADRGVVDMFLAEARLAATLRHQHIAEVTDSGEIDGVPYVAMEYFHGEDLRRLLARVHERSEQVPLPHVIEIAIAAGTGLHAAHEQRGTDEKSLEIVHRGVSPASILLGFDGNVKVVDFGIARATLRAAQTQTQMLRGTAPYMSPEQCTGKKLDRRSDVFSLGIVLYELATCRRLFKASNEYLTMAAIVACQVPPPSRHRADLPPSVDEILLRALSRDPAARYQTVQELVEAFEAVAIDLRSTPAALAAYATQLFGERPEPWSAPSTARDAVHIDFDGKGTGIAPPPAEALLSRVAPTPFKTKASPIEAARAQSLAGTPTAPVSPIVIPDGASRRDPTAPVVLSAPRSHRVTRAPVPPPTRQRPKTIQIPTSGFATPRSDTTLAGIGVVPAAADVTISGTGVVSTAPPAAPAADASLSGIGMVLPPSSGFEPGDGTTEIVAALAIETTVDAHASVPTANASSVAAASAVKAARGRSRSSGAINVSEPADAGAAAPKRRGRARSSGPAVVAGPTRSTESSPAAEPLVEPARGTPRLSVMAFAARPREVSAVSPVVVPPSTTRLSAPIPVAPAVTLDESWDSTSFPAPPSATAFVPMGAGDAVMIGPPPAIDDEPADTSSVLTPSFVGAVEIIDAPDRNSTEIVTPLPTPRPSAPPGDAWANGDDDLDGWPSPRRWWPFAAIAGAAVLLVIVLAVALSGGKDKPVAPLVEAPEDPGSATMPAQPTPAASETAARSHEPASAPNIATSASPTTSAPPTVTEAANVTTSAPPTASVPATATEIRPTSTTKVATTAKPPTSTSKVAPTASQPTRAKVTTSAKPPPSTSKVTTTAKQPPSTSKLAPTARVMTPPAKSLTSKVAPTAKQPTATSRVAPTAKQPTATRATVKQPATTSRMAPTANQATSSKLAPTARVTTPAKPTSAAKAKPPAATSSKIAPTANRATTSKLAPTAKVTTPAKPPPSKVAPTAKPPSTTKTTLKIAPAKPPTATSKVVPAVKQPASAGKKPAPASTAKPPVLVGRPASKPKK